MNEATKQSDDAADRLEELNAAVKKPCVWTLDDDFYVSYDGTCGVKWMFSDGGPIENECNYCPRCGGRIKVNTCKTY